MTTKILILKLNFPPPKSTTFPFFNFPIVVENNFSKIIKFCFCFFNFITKFKLNTKKQQNERQKNSQKVVNSVNDIFMFYRI